MQNATSETGLCKLLLSSIRAGLGVCLDNFCGIKEDPSGAASGEVQTLGPQLDGLGSSGELNATQQAIYGDSAGFT